MKPPQIRNRELHRVVATAIIYTPLRQGYGGASKFLIIKRSPNKKAFPGKWTVPGGGLEVDDYVNSVPTAPNIWYFALEKTLRREVAEETGLEMGPINYLLDLVLLRPDGLPVLTLSFYAPWKKGRVKLNSESVDFAWVTVQEAKKYDLIDGILQEIQMVDLILQGKNHRKVNFKK